jgi:phage regulator Rha-like protein
MQLQILNSSNEQTMLLKEITDLLDVRHNDAMNVVERMAKESEFGTITKISYTLPMPNNASKQIETCQLNKRQSIAVSARLNTALLMRIVDRWQELEAQVVQKPIDPMLMIAQMATSIYEQNQRQFQLENSQKKLEEKVEILTSKAEAIIDQSDYFSVMGYCRLKKISISNAKASGLSRSIGKYCDDNIIPKQEIADPRFGKVWTYPSAVILKFLTLKGFIAGE